MPDKGAMEGEALLHQCIELCEDRQAVDVAAYDLRGASVLADFMLVCSGKSLPQLRAIVGHVEKSLKKHGVHPRHIEGAPESRWVLMDYSDILIHVFHPDMRGYYCIEELLDPARRVHPAADERDE